MTVSKPITMLAICSAVLALGLAALFHDQYGIVPFFAPFQRDVWARLGTAEIARPLWAKAAEIGFSGAAGAVTIYLLLRTRIPWAGLFVLGALATAFTAALMLARAQAIALNVLAPAIVLGSVFAAGAWVPLQPDPRIQTGPALCLRRLPAARRHRKNCPRSFAAVPGRRDARHHLSGLRSARPG